MTKLRLRTKTPREVRKTLNRVMNMLVNNEIEPGVANAIIKGCNAVLLAIRLDDQQQKIEELEKILIESKEPLKRK